MKTKLRVQEVSPRIFEVQRKGLFGWSNCHPMRRFGFLFNNKDDAIQWMSGAIARLKHKPITVACSEENKGAGG
jgi:hypothetical protein